MTSNSDQFLTTPDGDEKDITQDNSELKHRSSKKDLLEIDRFTICGNRIDWICGSMCWRSWVLGQQMLCCQDRQMLNMALKYLFKNLNYYWQADLSIFLPVMWPGWGSDHKTGATSALTLWEAWWIIKLPPAWPSSSVTSRTQPRQHQNLFCFVNLGFQNVEFASRPLQCKEIPGKLWSFYHDITLPVSYYFHKQFSNVTTSAKALKKIKHKST